MGEAANRNLFTWMVILSFFISLVLSFWHTWVFLVLAATPFVYRSIKIVYEANDAISWNNALKGLGYCLVSGRMNDLLILEIFGRFTCF